MKKVKDDLVGMSSVRNVSVDVSHLGAYIEGDMLKLTVPSFHLNGPLLEKEQADFIQNQAGISESELQQAVADFFDTVESFAFARFLRNRIITAER